MKTFRVKKFPNILCLTKAGLTLIALLFGGCVEAQKTAPTEDFTSSAQVGSSTSVRISPKLLRNEEFFEGTVLGAAEPIYRPIERNGHIASVGRPVIGYWAIPADSLSDAIELSLQKLGFALNPTDVKSAEVCPKERRQEVIAHPFWTDYLSLDERMLKTLGINFTDLGLPPSSAMLYRFQVNGCWEVSQSLSRAIEQRETREQLYGNTESPLWSSIKYFISIRLEQRGRVGAFYPVPEYRPHPIIEVLEKHISSKSSELKKIKTDTNGHLGV